MPRGRNKHLIEQRNAALIRRYYYWTELQRLRFDDALKILSEQEFFLSEARIMAIIRQACRECRELKVQPRRSASRASRRPSWRSSPANSRHSGFPRSSFAVHRNVVS